MGKILIFKTSVDGTIKRLLKELGEKDIDCLVQSSQYGVYQKEYPYINFIDICGERFENLPTEIVGMISGKKYDVFYVTLSGVYGFNFWNVMELADKVNFKNAFFYNCNGKKTKIPGKNRFRDALCRLYIKWIEWIY